MCSHSSITLWAIPITWQTQERYISQRMGRIRVGSETLWLKGDVMDKTWHTASSNLCVCASCTCTEWDIKGKVSTYLRVWGCSLRALNYRYSYPTPNRQCSLKILHTIRTSQFDTKTRKPKREIISPQTHYKRELPRLKAPSKILSDLGLTKFPSCTLNVGIGLPLLKHIHCNNAM